MKKQLFKGRPDFPNEEPIVVAPSNTTNDTAQIFCIDTGGVQATFNGTMLKINDNGTTSASGLQGTVFTGVLYGRWLGVGANVQLMAYAVETANSEE